MAAVREGLKWEAAVSRMLTVITNRQFLAFLGAIVLSAAIALTASLLYKSENVFEGKDLRCAIGVGQNMFDKNAMMAGLSYEMLEQFALDKDCNIEILAYGKKQNGRDSLTNGAIDILVEVCNDSLCVGKGDNLLFSNHYEDIHWAVRQDRRKEYIAMKLWLEDFVSSESYSLLREKFNAIKDPRKIRALKGDNPQISPYDQIIRQYADSIGWDWRMLAAIVYQESRFALNTRSHRGAVGLMQIKPSTAENYNVDDLANPEKNIYAGTKHLRHLDRLFHKFSLSREERTKIVLAAYNAGEGRILECIKLAGKMGADSTTWSGISELIPLFRSDSLASDDSALLVNFKGDETIAYVDNIMEIYESFCRIMPE